MLAELVPGLPGLDAVTDALATAGLPVEAVEESPGIPRKVIAGRIVSADQVPGSDHLYALAVDLGRKRGLVAVSGAPNARAGLITAVALPGAKLPGAGEVRVREIAGVRSEAVVCSPRELGVGEYAAGLIEFGPDVVPGSDLAELWPADTVLDLGVTPNRADAFAVLGVAWDVAARLGLQVEEPPGGLPPRRGSPLGVRIELAEDAACDVFTARLAAGVLVRPSPLWLQRRLAALGLRPRNIVVDVTNYLTRELGQPMHAYDLDQLPGSARGHLVGARRARRGERLVTLDGVERQLDPGDTVIFAGDRRTPVGLGGVIGGESTEVTSRTTSVLMEAAHFHPTQIRRTARRQGLTTDAAYRFERGVDANLTVRAQNRAMALLAEHAGAQIRAGIAIKGRLPRPRTIRYQPEAANRLLGTHWSATAQRKALKAVGCRVQGQGPAWRVTPPSRRLDLAIAEDLIEEVARVIGFGEVPETLPGHVPIRGADPAGAHARELVASAAGLGLQEVVCYGYIGDAWLTRCRAPAAPLRLRNPISAERNVMRTALYPSLLEVLINNGRSDLALVERGRAWPKAAREVDRLAILLTGAVSGRSWMATIPADALVLKGVLAALAATRGAGLEVSPANGDPPAHLHPRVAGRVLWAGKPAGWMGRLHPGIEADLELAPTFVAELDLPLPAGRGSFVPPPRFPPAVRDLAVIAPKDLPYASVIKAIRAAGTGHLARIDLFDVYTGAPVPDGQRSLAMTLTFRDASRTLTDAEVDGAMQAVTEAVRAHGLRVRDAATTS
jgi:phenylalanyl-tRNA synthetase beta chain